VVRSDRKTIVHHEILTRIHHGEGRHLSAGALLPLAEQLGVMPDLDRIILEHIFALPSTRFTPPKMAINLSPLSLTDEEFTTWLFTQLQQCTDTGLQLSFEFPEFRAMQHLGLLKTFAERIRPMGHTLGIDHFGQGLTHFGYLRSLMPDYVKIDRAITNEVHTDKDDSSFFVSTLCTVAHSLDIRVIVEGVETEQQWSTITALPVDAVQGYYIQRPEPVM
jgi:EAL domain-containing protein (putative c-di-GMP-specific phosphodiesterase class I)